MKYTVDDGRKVNETCSPTCVCPGPRRARPAPGHRPLRGPEGPGAAASGSCPSAWPRATSGRRTTRVAWVRALQVDERLTVMAAAPGHRPAARRQAGGHQGLPQERRQQDAGRARRAADDGDPFPGQDGRRQHGDGQALQVCRGYARLAPPLTPATRIPLADEHSSAGPLRAPDHARRSPVDGAWTQGLSEEGGARMKTTTTARRSSPPCSRSPPWRPASMRRPRRPRWRPTRRPRRRRGGSQVGSRGGGQGRPRRRRARPPNRPAGITCRGWARRWASRWRQAGNVLGDDLHGAGGPVGVEPVVGGDHGV